MEIRAAVSALRMQAQQRTAALQAELRRLGAAAGIVTSPAGQTYLSGFRALLYSRPIVLVATPDSSTLVVPGLEEAHARADAAADEIIAYHERPDATGPATFLECIDQVLGRLPRQPTTGVEYGTCSAGLAQHLTRSGCRLVDLDPWLTRVRGRKDDVELSLMRTAASVAATGVSASLAACRAGVSEIEVDGAGTTAVLGEAATFGDGITVDQLIMTPSGAARTTLPHVFSTTRRLASGDGLIHTRQVGICGYRAELERTGFVGSPDDRQRRAFEVMRAAQQRAVDTIRPGTSCRHVDAAARGVIAAAGLGAFAVHRSGHGIGLAPHEPPYIRHDEDAKLEEGMVITVEPGLYVPGLGGFRHSDTFVVTSGGVEPITDHPSDVDSLTLGDPRP